MARGHSYNDPVYDSIEARLEKKYGLTPGLMRGIRTKGERSNSDQVSEADARSVYQIIPDTRARFMKAYGVDAYASIEGAAEVAALHLRDSKKRNGGDDRAAVLEYHGGTNRQNWGERTQAYGRRVSGRANTPTSGDGYKPNYYGSDVLTDYSGDWLRGSPGREKPMDRHVPKETSVDKAKRLNRAGMGAEDLSHVTDGVDRKAVGIGQLRDTEIAGTEEANENREISPWTRLKASWLDNTLTASIMRHMDEEALPQPEPGMVDYYLKNREEIEKDADDDERAALREATSIEHLTRIQADQTATRERRELYTAKGIGSTDALLYTLMGGAADPAGFAAGEGFGLLLRGAGIGARALYGQRKVVRGIASQAAEYGGGNVAVTGWMDANGDHITSKDYAMSAALGATLGVAASPFTLGSVNRGLRKSTEVADLFEREAANAREEMGELFTQAETNLGAGATPDQVAAEAARLDRDNHLETVKIALADQPEAVKMLDGDNVLTSDPALVTALEGRYDLAGISDDTERKLVTEMLARSERGMNMIDVNEKRLNPATRWFGAQSTGIDLLRSKSPIMRFFGAITTEGTTGAAGRRRTAALAQHTRERVYNSELRGYAGLYHLYRKEKGVGLYSESIDGKVYSDFEREVFLELEARADEASYAPHSNPLIREAADMAERGFDKMRIEQQHVGTAGNARLGTTSKGYVPHRLLGTEVLRLSNAQRSNVRSILSRQFQNELNGIKYDAEDLAKLQTKLDKLKAKTVGTKAKAAHDAEVAELEARIKAGVKTMDKEFADKLSVKYLERAIDKAKGGYDVPMTLMDPHAADMLEDALEAMGVNFPNRQDIMGKFSRAGATHTKKRLRLDLNEDIGDGKKLVDLYDTSVGNLYRGYSRRVSGEVALAQFGIIGRKGLLEVKKAAMHSGADNAELRAFDQVASEFLNMPFGDLGTTNYKWMDNIRIATSLARLGGMGFTQMAEYGNGINALGAQRVISSVGDMPRLIAEVRAIHKGNAKLNPLLKDLDLLGGHLGLDEFVNTRLFDVKDNSIQMYGTESIGVGTRYLRAGANAQAIMSGHRMIMATQVRGMAEQIVRKTMTYVSKGLNDKALDDMGIDAALRARLKANLSDIAKFEKGSLMSLDLTKGNLTGHEIMTLRDAIERGASQIIQRTYIGETGIWAHDGLLKLLTQFRTFGITSIEKQWGRQYHTHGLKAFAYMVGAFSFSTPIYLARTKAKMALMGEEEAQDYADKHLTPVAIGLANINYMSSTGLLSDGLDLGLGVAGGAFGMELGDDFGARGQYRGGLVGGQIAPGVGLINDVFTGVKDGNGDKLIRAFPGNSLPYVQGPLNGLTSD